MNDLKQSSVFNDKDDDYIEEWDFLDEQAFWLFNCDVSNAERKFALDKIKVKQEHYDNIRKSQYSLDQEKRVQAKIKEMIEKGLVEPDSELEKLQHPKDFITRYGRSPLHEAVAMRDIRLVKKYIELGKYLDKVDNNGHTAMEMAYYDNYKEALILFEKHGNLK
jgi:ankyrin repeat protein